MDRPAESHTQAKVLVAMSGGVDSSVAAALLKQRGYDVVGCFMRLGNDDTAVDGEDTHTQRQRDDAPSCRTHPLPIKPGHQGCCSVSDAADARLVAAMLDIPLYVLNFKKDFGRIIDYFVDEYNAGRTPNPCVRCNDWLKFGKLLAYADIRSTPATSPPAITRSLTRAGAGCDAQVTPPGPGPTEAPATAAASTRRKDQSYVLFGTARWIGSTACSCPSAIWLKSASARLARATWVCRSSTSPTARRSASCPTTTTLASSANAPPTLTRSAAGRSSTTPGNTIGQHRGHQHYTIGQRRGLSLSLGHPIYVVDKDPPRQHHHRRRESTTS